MKKGNRLRNIDHPGAIDDKGGQQGIIPPKAAHKESGKGLRE
jgi:hypothetical protein